MTQLLMMELHCQKQAWKGKRKEMSDFLFANFDWSALHCVFCVQVSQPSFVSPLSLYHHLYHNSSHFLILKNEFYVKSLGNV